MSDRTLTYRTGFRIKPGSHGYILEIESKAMTINGSEAPSLIASGPRASLLQRFLSDILENGRSSIS